MPNADADKELPRNRSGRPLTWLERLSIRQLTGIGLLLYICIVLFISVLEYAFHVAGYDFVFNNNSAATDFWDILYFNFTTALTIGYGDLHPVHFGKFISIIEAFIGVALFSSMVAVLTAKAFMPPRNTIVFSKYAYYCTEPQRFLIIFQNTSDMNLGNVEISSYFKLGGDWRERPSITSPLITRSVQTFYLDRLGRSRLVKQFKNGDCLRVGIVGGLGFASFSTSIQYDANEILVIPNRNELVTFFETHHDSTDPKFQRMFHYRPERALTLLEYVGEDHLQHAIRPSIQG